MGDTNFMAGIIKILESPKEKVWNNNTISVEFRAQLPQIRQNQMVKIAVWGNLAHDVLNYYKINDYILIEGFVSLRSQSLLSSKGQQSKKVEITVLRLYPFLLSYNDSSQEME